MPPPCANDVGAGEGSDGVAMSLASRSVKRGSQRRLSDKLDLLVCHDFEPSDHVGLEAAMTTKASITTSLRDLSVSISKAQEDLRCAEEHLTKAFAKADVCLSPAGFATGPTSSRHGLGPLPEPGSARSYQQLGGRDAAAALDDDGSQDQTSVCRKVTFEDDLPPVGHHVASRGSEETASQSARPSVLVKAETLLETWPESLAIRWHAQLPESESSATLTVWRSHTKRSLTSALDDSGRRAGPGARSARGCVIHPSSSGRVAYDIIGAVLLAFDFVVIPFMVAWDIELVGVLLHMGWLTAVWWSADICISFVTAHTVNGVTVDDQLSVAWRYISSWFFPDLLFVSCDWVSLLLANSTSWRALRLTKAGRFLRLMTLFRLLKLARAVSDFIDEKLPGAARLTVQFAKLIIIMLVYSHMMSCIWFLIGRSGPSDTGLRWIDSPDLAEGTIAYQYVSSLQWAFAQITLGGTDIPSRTSLERVYSILALVIGLLFGSTLVSTLSAKMLQNQMDKQETHQKIQLMRRYLRDNKVDRLLALQVERQLAERLVGRENIKEENVDGLKLLSSSLRSQLRLHLCAPHLKRHSLFQMWLSIDLSYVQEFCTECMYFVQLRAQDDLFVAGKEAEGAYFFVSGSITYVQEPLTSPVMEATSTEVEAGRWVAEAALWSHWIHVGTARACQYSEVAGVQVAKMVDFMQRTTVTVQLTRDYCREFHRRLQVAKPPTSRWPDDVQVPLTDWSDVVPAMNVDSQIVIGLESIGHVAERRTWRVGASVSDKLTREVTSGKSAVMLDSKGELERVVSVVVLKIYSSEGQILVQIGKEEAGGAMKPLCQLPGGKQGVGELPSDTARRVLANKISQIQDDMSVSNTDRDVEWKESKEFGVRTKYIRHIFICKADSGAGLEACKLPEVEWDRASQGTLSAGSSLNGLHHVAARFSMAMQQSTVGSADAEILSKQDARVLCNRSVFCVRDSAGCSSMYAWFSDEEFEKLKGPAGERLLSKWMLSLQRAAATNFRRPSYASATPSSNC